MSIDKYIDDRDQERKIMTPRKEPSVENSEFEFFFQNELVENGTCIETTLFSSQEEPDNMSGFTNIDIENQKISENFHPTNDIKSEPFEDISDNTTFVDSIKKEPMDTALQKGFIAQEEMNQPIFHKDPEFVSFNVEPKIELNEVYLTEINQYEKHFEEDTKRTSNIEEIEMLNDNDTTDQEVYKRASKVRKRKSTTNTLPNCIVQGRS